MILEDNVKKWGSIIKEELGIEDRSKLDWISRYATFHELYESVQGQGSINAMPLNTGGMGNPMMPMGIGFAQGSGMGNTGQDFHSPMYQTGSGDTPFSTLTMSLYVAATTIAMDLVPVIPTRNPVTMLRYMDFPYMGGKLGHLGETIYDGKGDGAENKPMFIKIVGAKFSTDELKKIRQELEPKAEVKIQNEAGDSELLGQWVGLSRIDGCPILKVLSVLKDKENISISELFGTAAGQTINKIKVTLGDKITDKELENVRPDLVAAMDNHIQGFANFFDGSDDPMTRAQNETGVGNTIGARFYSKLVQVGSYEVTGSVTRQQLQDMPLYGIDIVAKVLEAMQDNISQSINNRILDRLFKLGTTNAIQQRRVSGVDFNTYFAGTAGNRKLNEFKSFAKYIDINGKTPEDTTWEVPNATKNTAAENTWTLQRRIMSRILAAANHIAVTSRFGRANWVVTNTQVLSALQDSSGFIAAPMENTLSQSGANSIYFAGTIAGMNLYVDPNMTWDDTRVLVGRKSNGETPGVVFMPYILADQVQTLAEGTMAPKLLTNSRFAIVDLGFHPEASYYCFMVDCADDTQLI